MEESSQLIPVELYGRPAFVTESGTEGGDESCSDSHVPGPSTRTEQSNIPHLSGRSRAILKEYFDEATPVRFPVGHNTIALTEPRMYHLLRVLTDETLRRSFTTMERMLTPFVEPQQPFQIVPLISRSGVGPKPLCVLAPEIPALVRLSLRGLASYPVVDEYQLTVMRNPHFTKRATVPLKWSSLPRLSAGDPIELRMNRDWVLRWFSRNSRNLIHPSLVDKTQPCSR